MNEKLYRVDQFYPGDFAQILTGVYTYITGEENDTGRGNPGFRIISKPR